MAGATGEVIPFERPDTTVAKQEYTDAIRMWCVNRQLSDALTREEIGALPKDIRIDAQRKTLIEGMAHYLRKHERSDVAMGVYLVLTLLSDNERGCASISQPTLAKLFGRSVSSIGEAQKRLKDAGLIVMGRGRYAGTYPVIPRAMVQSYNHMTWLVAAICDQEKPLNLPAGHCDCQSTGQTGGLSQSTDETSGLKLVNQPVEVVSINRPDPVQVQYLSSTTLDNTDGRDGEGSVPRRFAASIASVLTAALPVPLAAAPIEQPAIVQTISLTDRLLDAGGRAMGNPASCPGLILMSEPSRWIEQGCDLEKDILPAIRARTARMPPNSIKSWSYFTQAVTDAKAARLSPLPEGHVPRPKSQASNWHDEQDRALNFLFRKET